MDKLTIRRCPDCGGVISWNDHFKAFVHENSKLCCYEETLEGKCVWNNARREEALEKMGLKKKEKSEIEKDYNIYERDDLWSL